MCRDVHRNARRGMPLPNPDVYSDVLIGVLNIILANAGGITSSPTSPYDSVSETASHVQKGGRLAPQLMPSVVAGASEVCLRRALTFT